MSSFRSDSPQDGEDPDACLKPTWFLDSNDPEVVDFTRRSIGDASTPTQKAVRLFYAVRDGIWYNPYAVVADRNAYRASAILRAPSAFCVQKAIVLAAAARAAGIPSRLGFADVRNHLASEKLREKMKTDLFVFHGFTELYLGGTWIKATPTFNRELCERFRVRPLDFDGTCDAIFHPFDEQNRRHMEYVRYHGSFADFPFDEMVLALAKAYPDMVEEHHRGAMQDQEFDPHA
jgi:transglutaminase-like putative cysteine protease